MLTSAQYALCCVYVYMQGARLGPLGKGGGSDLMPSE